MALDLLSERADTVLDEHEPLLSLAKLDELDVHIGAECFALGLELNEPGSSLFMRHLAPGNRAARWRPLS